MIGSFKKQTMPITWSCAGLSIPWNQPERSLSELANEADIEIVSACGGKVSVQPARYKSKKEESFSAADQMQKNELPNG